MDKACPWTLVTKREDIPTKNNVRMDSNNIGLSFNFMSGTHECIIFWQFKILDDDEKKKGGD
jgi:hypothetical protein